MKINGATLTGTAKVSLFKGRYKYIYGVNGAGRGIRWDGTTANAEAIGMKAPTSGTTVAALTTVVTASTNNIIATINMVAPGSAYFQPPDVTFTGGGLTDGSTLHAKGLAQLRNGGVAGVIVTKAGVSYTGRPQVAFSGGRGSGATVTVNVDGSLSEVLPLARGSGYTNGATLSFTGISDALAEPEITDGKITGVRITNPGYGATGVATATVHPISGGSGASVQCVMSYAVTSLSVSGGTGYAGSIPVVFSSASGSGAAAFCTANSSGAPTSPEVTSRGSYSIIPTASVNGEPARANALIRPPIKGSYRCAFRYLDQTPIAEGGPIPSNLSDLVTVDVTTNAGVIGWRWSNAGADTRAQAVELWRTSANQAIVLYRVAILEKVAGVLPATYEDTLDEASLLDPTREGYALLPITLPSGQLNAYRFSPPPEDMEDACWFQDRAWYAVSSTGSKPNTLYYSEIDEPESVPEINELVIQNNTGSQDRVVALIPYGTTLIAAQERHMYTLTYVAQPVIDAAVTLAGYRGLLNKRCFTTFEGGLYCVDSFGMYSFDGVSMEPLSVAVDNYWRDSIIDFSKSANFFVQADPQSRVIRFYYCNSSDGTIPPRALCYSLATKTWWEETYAQGLGSAAVVRVAGKQSLVCGGGSGALLRGATGLVDAATTGTTSVPYQVRTGPLAIVDEPTRQIGVVYTPTSSTASLIARVHYNNSTAYRPNAIASDRGDGVQAATTGAVIDLRASRSALGDSNGYATVRFSGRASDRSAGGDRHLAVDLSGAQSASPVTIHSVAIGGVT